MAGNNSTICVRICLILINLTALGLDSPENVRPRDFPLDIGSEQICLSNHAVIVAESTAAALSVLLDPEGVVSVFLDS